MRALLLATMLVADLSIATECLHVDAEAPITLRGTIGYQYSRDLQKFGSGALVLHLVSPICVMGFDSEGGVFRHENVALIDVATPKQLIGVFRPGEQVTVRGVLWDPAVNEAGTKVRFEVKEIL